LVAGYSRQNPDQVDISGGRLGSGGVSDRNATAELTWDPSSSHAFSFESSFGVQEALAPSVPDTAGNLQAGWGASHLQRLSLRAGYEGRWRAGSARIDIYRNSYRNEVGEIGQDVEAEVEDLTAE